MFWAAFGLLALTVVLFILGWKAETAGNSADEKSGSALLYLAGLATFILSVLFWAIAITLAALGHH